jgi:anti-sigma regulatory factor (Ser/Thr protein kinase)
MKTPSKVPARLLRCLIPARLEAVDAVCLELRAFMTANGLAVDAFAVELIARECLNNTVLHGNQNQADKTATLSLSLGQRWLRLQIADQGVGFNWRQACRTAADPAASSGRGLAISMLYADRVLFNQRGNQITLWFDNSGTAKRHEHGNIHA